MKREEVAAILVDKITNEKWHFLAYHFSQYKKGLEHFLCASIFDACLRVESEVPGYVESFANKLAEISGREMYIPHFEQIIQLLSELYVINHMVSIGLADAKYVLEPRASGSDKNPEIGVILPDKKIYVEVKCREFTTHHNNRGMASVEVPARIDGIRELASRLLKDKETIVYPRDNVIKDFLVSANEKFRGFKKEAPDAITMLVIVWDDFIYEPITSLLNEHSGLLTEKSFFRNGDQPVKFENIDAVIIVRQSHQIVAATRDQFPCDGLMHPLDWGRVGSVLPKAYVPINTSSAMDSYLCEIMQAQHISELSHAADYRPQELVLHV